ncbi:MAG: hypothetical protein P4L16_01975 [Chlamydiales bacterium]|nr:hypothetical protein [Chlamydiales bacterium]
MRLTLKLCAATASMLLASGAFAQSGEYTYTPYQGDHQYNVASYNTTGYNSVNYNAANNSVNCQPVSAPAVYQPVSASTDCCADTQPAAPCDQPTNDCWCRYVHWQPCHYQTQRCVEEQIPCQKQCCRMVPKYYQVQQCKYVPQYYTVTVCRNEPEYYCEPDCKTVQRTVCDTHCRYVPQYYWKHVCNGDANMATPQGY